jgi:hypothetical protein
MQMFTCRRCNKNLPETSYRIRSDRTNYRVKSCRVCEKEESKELEQIRKVAPKRSVFCDCCGKKPDKKSLYLDHCHEKLTFRGWLCNRCNLGIASLGDDIQGLERAIEYLKGVKHDSIRY